MATENWIQHRAILSLTVRFGHSAMNTWDDCLAWLASEFKLWQAEQELFNELVEKNSVGLLLILYSQLPQADPATSDLLLRTVSEASPPITVEELIQSWSKRIPINERRALLGIPEPVPPPIPPIIATIRVQPPPLPWARPETPVSIGAEPPPVIPPPAGPPRPSLWQQHIQPLFVEN